MATVSIRLQRNKKIIADSGYDEQVIREILEKYNDEIDALEKRMRSSKNKFIQLVCKKDIEQLWAEKNELDTI